MLLSASRFLTNLYLILYSKLGQVLATKRFLLGYLRKQERVLSRLEDKAAKLDSVQNAAENGINELVEEIKQCADQMEHLRHQVQDDAHQQQSLASQTAQIRGSVSRLELDRDSLAKNLITAKKQRDEISIDKDMGILKELENKKAVVQSSMTMTELKQTSDSLDKTQKSMELALARHEEIRVEYNLPVGHPRVFPTLEMGHFQDLLEKEMQATGTEEKSKLALISEMAKHRSEMICLRIQVSTLEQEKQQNISQLEEDQKICLDLSEKESFQKQASAEVVARLEELRAAHKVRMTEDRNKNAQAEERNFAIRQQVDKLEKHLEIARRRYAEKQDGIATCKQTRGKIVSEANESIEEGQKAILALKKEMKDLAKLDSTEDPPPSDKDYNQLAENIVAGEQVSPSQLASIRIIAHICAFSFSDNPSLEMIEVVHDPKLTVKEQLKRDFSSILRECDKRVESAKKMRKDLDEASRREGQERHELKRRMEKERQRKEETRRRRENRLEAQKAVESSKTGLSVKDKSRKEEGRRKEKIERSGRDESKERTDDGPGKLEHANRKDEGRRKDKAERRERDKSKDRKVELSERNEQGDRHKAKSDKSKDKMNARKEKDKQSTRDKSKEPKERDRRTEKADRSGRSKSRERNESERRKENTEQEQPKEKADSRRSEEDKRERQGRETGHSGDDKKRAHGSDQAKSSSSSSKAKKQDGGYHTEVKPCRDPDAIPEAEQELDIVALSAAKPRNLLTTFSQSSETPEEWKAVPSSQKKVTWQADQDDAATQKTQEGGDKKIKKTFRGGSISITSSRLSAKATTAKSSKPDRQVKSKEKRTFGEKKARRHYDAKKPSHASSGRIAASTATDSLLSLDGAEKKKSSRSSSSGNAAKDSKRRAPANDDRKSRSKRSGSSKTDKTSMKRSHQSSGISSGEQRAQKRRRNGATAGNTKPASSKSTGAQSFGTDVAFSF